MPKYKVIIETATFRTTVKAKSQKQAIDKAEDEYVRSGIEPEITVWVTSNN